MKNIYVISLSGVSVINPSTKVYKNAKTLGKCKICEKPFGGEKVFGEAKVFGGFPVYGNAETYGKHRIISVSKKKHIHVIKQTAFRYMTANIKK